MSLATEIAGKLNYLNAQDKVAVNATLPYSGYTQVSKKLDNFVFQTSSSFLNKVADKNRYVKFGEKVVDTYGPELITNGDFSNGTTGWSINSNGQFWDVSQGYFYSSGYTVVEQNLQFEAGKTYLIEANVWDVAINFEFRVRNNIGGYDYLQSSANPDVYTSTRNKQTSIVFKALSSSISILFYSSVAGRSFKVDNISVREIQTAQFTVPNVTEIVAESSGITTVQVNASDYVIQSKTSPTDHTSTTFRAKQTVPIGTALTDTTYFEDRTQIGVTNQALAYHAYNVLTNSYEGIKTEVLFSDVSKEDLLDNSVWMARNGFSKVSEFLYSKGSYLCLPVGIWQSLNKGAYHPVLNSMGVSAIKQISNADHLVWYESLGVTKLLNTMDCFTSDSEYQANVGLGSIVNGGSWAVRPDSKYYDIVYPDQFIDVREYAKVLTPYEVELIRADKEENGVEETTFTYESDSTIGYTNSYVYIYNLGRNIGDYIYYHYNDGTNYIYGKGRLYQIVATEYRITKDAIFTNMVPSNYYSIANVLLTKTIPVLSSNTKLSTDLIGNPNNYPQIMKDRLASGVGVVGINPLLVSDTGGNLTVDSVIKYRDKAVSIHTSPYSSNAGVTWTGGVPVADYVLNLRNTGLIFPTSTHIGIECYTSKNNPYIQTTPKPVVDVEPKVKASNSHSIFNGALVGNQVADKIQVGNGTNGYESKVLENSVSWYDYSTQDTNAVMTFTGMIIYVYPGRNGADGKGLDGNYYKYIGTTTSLLVINSWANFGVTSAWIHLGRLGTAPVHGTIALDNSNSPASKWFECLEEGNNGVLAGVYGQEVVYGADTGNFANLSNGTTTDFSNNTVRTFHGAIPLNGKIK